MVLKKYDVVSLIDENAHKKRWKWDVNSFQCTFSLILMSKLTRLLIWEHDQKIKDQIGSIEKREIKMKTTP